MTSGRRPARRRLGIDVGGTTCLGVVLDEHGDVVSEQRRATPKGPDAIIDTLVELAGALAPYDSIGVGVPGLVARDGVLRAAPNLVDINDFQVGSLLSARLDGFSAERLMNFLTALGNDVEILVRKRRPSRGPGRIHVAGI